MIVWRPIQDSELRVLKKADWESIPDSVYKEYDKKQFWVKTRENLLAWFTILGPFALVTPPYLLVSHWDKYYLVYPESSFVVRFKWLWQFLDRPEFFFGLGYPPLFLLLMFLSALCSGYNNKLWEDYVDRIETRFPSKDQ